MLINRPDDIKPSEITDESAFLNRRTFMRGAILAGTTFGTASIFRMFANPPRTPTIQDVAANPPIVAPKTYDVPDEAPTPFESVTNYNNYYEFSLDKRSVAEKAANLVTRPWTISVDGLVDKPRTFDVDDLARLFPTEERVYRFRCVEAWSMVVPWLGFPLAALLNEVRPLSSATYVAFQTLFDPQQMPVQNSSVLDWPYVEGLRMDEAMHPLTLLSTGLYGQRLLPQNGAPIRLVVPWKYGFKSIKSIVRISLVDRQPPTTWNLANPSEYGFYSNVNPAVNHPRWSQASERRIGDYGTRPTLPFNGYADQVASLYAGMDLKVNF